MGTNSSQAPITYTGGVRDNNGVIKRYDNAKDAYNSLYLDIHSKLNGGSSWVKPNTTLSEYISKFAPEQDNNNNPVSYTNTMVRYFKSKGLVVNENSTLSSIKNDLLKKGLDPEHEFTKAHLSVEDPKVLQNLKNG